MHKVSADYTFGILCLGIKLILLYCIFHITSGCQFGRGQTNEITEDIEKEMTYAFIVGISKYPCFCLLWYVKSAYVIVCFIGWAQEHELRLTHPRGWTTSKEEFDWSEYLEVTKSHAAPASCFSHLGSAKDLGFTQGMKLEAVNPENQHQICAASIMKIIDHLLWIHLESNDRL